MLDVFLTKEGGRIKKVVFKNVPSEICEEIAVCASVVTVIHTALLGLFQVAKVSFDYIDEANEIIFELPQKLTERQAEACSVILDTMLCGLTDLAVTFSDFFNLEVN